MLDELRGRLSRHGRGYLPDTPDARDRRLVGLLSEYTDSAPPLHASVRSGEVGPKDQLGTQSCTGQAVAQAIRIAAHVVGIRCLELSALFPYFCGRAIWGGQAYDGGSYLRTTLKAVMRLGIPEESVWPFSPWRVNRSPTFSAYHAAHDRHGLRGYYRIPSGDVDGVRRAIASGFPVVGGWQIGSKFYDYTGGVLGVQYDAQGGHAVVIDEYDGNTFGGLNSWGSSWGVGGFFKCSAEFIAEGADLWAVSIRAF